MTLVMLEPSVCAPRSHVLKLFFRYLWVGLAIVLCLAAAGLLVFFMFPRDVVLQSKRPYLDPVGVVAVNVSKQYVNFLIIVSTLTLA